jgi:hypothetical protein
LLDGAARLACACFSLLVYSVGLVAYTSIPAVQESWPYCAQIWNGYYYQLPERYFCIVTQNGVNSSLLAW